MNNNNKEVGLQSFQKSSEKGFGYYLIKNGSDQKFELSIKPRTASWFEFSKCSEIMIFIVLADSLQRNRTVNLKLNPGTIKIVIWVGLGLDGGPRFSLQDLGQI